MLLAVPGSRAVVLLLLLIDLCDRTTIFQSQPRLPKPNQRLPLLKTSISTETTTKTSISTETSTKTSISTESSTKTFTSIETSTKTSTTSATAILWLRACSGHSLSLSLLFLCDHHWQFIWTLDRIGTLVASATQRWKNIKCLSMCVVGRCSSRLQTLQTLQHYVEDC
jgi:hypothetical protein